MFINTVKLCLKYSPPTVFPGALFFYSHKRNFSILFFLQSFQHFQGLNEERIYNLLKSVSLGTMSPKEAGKEADSLKKMDQVKAAFLNLTNLQSWDKATEKYDKHTEEERLRAFTPKFTRSCEFYCLSPILSL